MISLSLCLTEPAFRLMGVRSGGADRGGGWGARPGCSM